MNYVIVSTSVTDRITLADGTQKGDLLGGAGSYALCGMKLWTDDTLLVTGVGADYKNLYGNWFQSNDISMAGLMVKDPHTAISNVQYQADGERVETPEYGLQHYQKLEATPEEIGAFSRNAKGVYIFKENDKHYWDRILALKKEQNFRLMWEINAGCANEREQDSIREIAQAADVFSINRTEASALFGGITVDQALEQLNSWGIPMVFFRMGASGAVILSGGKIYRIPSVQNTLIADVTGGGNSSSAGVFYGYCEGASPVACGVMGSISATACIRQYGVPPIFSAETRARAQCLRAEMIAQQTETGGIQNAQ